MHSSTTKFILLNVVLFMVVMAFAAASSASNNTYADAYPAEADNGPHGGNPVGFGFFNSYL
jgi:hypothetical protein